jgi:hypothetical protein
MAHSASGLGSLIVLGAVLFGAYSCMHHGDAPSAQAEEKADEAAADATAGTYKTDIGSAACTEDCEGHDAGYAWAREHDVDDEALCPDAHGESFEEGCKAFVQAYADAHDEAIEAKGKLQ